MTTTTTSLTADQILDRILNTKGSFVKAHWKSNPKPAAAHKSVLLEKITSAVCRAGIDYANLGVVKDAINNGERGEVESLPWGEWKKFPYIIEHKGVEYIRLYPSDGTNHFPTSNYFVNGEKVTKEDFAQYLTPSEAKKLLEPNDDDRPLCFTVKRENILGTEDVTESMNMAIGEKVENPKKNEILQKIAELESIQNSIKPLCVEFCADQNISIADRWEIFKIAPDKKHDRWYDFPSEKEVGLDEEISPYDDWYLERHETFDVVDRITDWEDDEKYPQDVIEKFKNYYMKSYTGSWEYDW